MNAKRATKPNDSANDRLQAEVCDPPPLDARHQPPLDRYCDVVLTGGVTDGVIYPWAVLELARKYRFKNIGGTSVGAMAAALTAAAEYSRRYGSLTGFNEVLRKLPCNLGKDVGGNPRLFSLFQPTRSTRRLFDLFVRLTSTTKRNWPQSAMLRVAFEVLRAYRRSASIGALVGILLAIGWLAHSGLSWALVLEFALSALPCAVLVATGVVVLCAIPRDLAQGFVQNNFGLCTGYRSDITPADQQSLVEWLHEGIQAASGKPLDRPLTFKDLWEAPGGPDGRPQPPTRQTRKERSIDLRMITTNLTHGRPYVLPPEDETSRLYYREADLKPYFPDAVLEHLKAHSFGYFPRTPGVDPDRTNVPEELGLRELQAGDLPVVVAARLSLSFPVLFSAVPLWAIDYEAKPEERTLHKCWFSDGGICSNFPIHLFDPALPRWPSFGFALVERSIYWPHEAVWLPKYYYQGWGDRWNRFDDADGPMKKLTGFAGSILWSAKNWKDKTSMRMPGVRERVIRINLKEGEGGLDLKMPAEQILGLANEYGLPAAQKLIEYFIDPDAEERPSTYWNEHRWVRFNALLVALRERIEGICDAAESAPYSEPLTTQIAQAESTPPLREGDASEEKKLTERQAKDLRDLLTALKELEARFAQAEMAQPYAPLPTPSMRIRPPL